METAIEQPSAEIPESNEICEVRAIRAGDLVRTASFGVYLIIKAEHFPETKLPGRDCIRLWMFSLPGKGERTHKPYPALFEPGSKLNVISRL
jgi:hypothetical protein